MQPAVTVVIPVYNTEPYVEQTLRSIMKQTLRQIEILVVDDGSTDGSPDILRRLAAEDARIRLHTQPNRGLSEARNAGLDRARGRYIYFMDSDDLLDGDALELCHDTCERERLDLLFFDAESFGAPTADAPWLDYRRAGCFADRTYSGAEVLTRMLDLGRYRASACLSFIRLDLLRSAGLRFYPGMLHEDELFTPQLYLSAARVGRIDRAFFKRRVRAGSIMGAPFSMRNMTGYLTAARELRRWAAARDAATRRLAARLTARFLNPAARNAWALPLPERLGIARALTAFPGSIGAGSYLRLLCKRPLRKLLRR